MYLVFLRVFITVIQLTLSLALQNGKHNLAEWIVRLKDSIQKDKVMIDENLETIGNQLERTDLCNDALANLRMYKTLLENELLNLTAAVMQMSTEEERLRISLREERRAVKNLTGHVDEYLSAKNNYSNELNHLKEENKKLEMQLENQTAEMSFQKIVDVHSGMNVIELVFRELFGEKERINQWSKFFKTVQAIVHQKNANTAANETSEKLKKTLKSPPERILKDLETYFHSPEEFGQTVEQLHKQLSDDIQSHRLGKPFADEKLPKLIRVSLQIILDAFLQD